MKPQKATYFPVIAGWQARHFPERLVLHPFVLGNLADAARPALHGGSPANWLRRLLVQTVQRAVNTARGSNQSSLLRTLCGPQSGGYIEGPLGRAQLAGLQRQLVQSGTRQPRRGGGVIGGGCRRRAGWGRVAVDGDLVLRSGRGGGRSHDVSSHWGRGKRW